MRKSVAAAAAGPVLALPTDVAELANSYAAQLNRLAPLASGSPRLLLRRLRALHARILTSGFVPRSHIRNRLIDLYSKSGDLASSRWLFDTTPHPDVVARTTLIVAYANSGDLAHARQVFDGMPLRIRDVVSYNSMISAYSRVGEGAPAVALFCGMVRCGFSPDDYTFTGILSAVASIPGIDLHQCGQLHASVVKYGTDSVISVSNALISLYFRCASPEAALCARRVFDSMQMRDEVTWTTVLVGYTRLNNLDGARKLFDGMSQRFDVIWNAMISAYVHQGCFSEALDMFRMMHSDGVPMDEFTYTSAISACVSLGLFKHGKSMHAHFTRAAIEFSPESALPVENVLVTLYSRCAEIACARQIFDRIRAKDSVSWNAILSGYVDLGHISDAWEIFESMPCKNYVAWTVMISGLAQNGFGEKGVRLFRRMKTEGFQPCDYAFSGAFIACAGLGALEHGRQLHSQLIRSGYDASNSAANALLTMYAKCGAVEAAHLVFLMMPNLDSVSWNAMVAALAQHGQGNEAIDLFDYMLREDIYPDRITFLTILSACNHAGLVDEGLQFLRAMEHDFGISPGEDHYAQVIDLLGRAGQVTEAMDLIDSLPFKPGPSIWEAVLSACRIHGDMNLGIYAADKLFKMIPQHDGTYVLLSNMYASAGLWDDVARVRKLMRDRQIKKEPGCSWIEVASKVHVFLVNDTAHPDVREVYNFLEMVGAKMRKLGYVPDTKFALHDVDSEKKEYVLSTHSEKLAVAFGLLKLPPGATVRVFKNLRICGDCHTAIMFISKVVEREVVVRDGKRFHHFSDGVCSCSNYW
uniref:Pentatricopeptide repeat-containing protein At1g25360 n=1 Tax=Anthurium amnicola TaxID=1678845 RepID=A0A1D1ZCE4_9ARAE